MYSVIVLLMLTISNKFNKGEISRVLNSSRDSVLSHLNKLRKINKTIDVIYAYVEFYVNYRIVEHMSR